MFHYAIFGTLQQPLYSNNRCNNDHNYQCSKTLLTILCVFVMTVKRKFGSAGSDLFVMAPTTSQPILIERFCGECFKNVA